ncbi:MAG: nitrous oxide-stimulated promoter family protein [Raoultibacter sp.]
MEDTPSIAKRREREKRTISQMVALHCAGNHDANSRTERAYCGEAVCPECKEIDEYSVLRTERCRKMDIKTSCDECENHCYKPEEREKIRAVMRHAGPRMMTKHPIAAIRHLIGK